MSKRVHFEEDVEVAEEGPSSSKKMALSSNEEKRPSSKGDAVDEEDQDFVFAAEDDDDMGELDITEIRHQEAANVDEEDGIKFTAFNLEEEMEDGHFDKAGNFIFNKNADLVKDNWLDNIDWSSIKKQANNSTKDDKDDSGSDNDSDKDESSSEGEAIDRVAVYEKIVSLLNPGESVKQGIRRYGGSSGANKNKNRMKAKKEQVSVEDQEKMTKLCDYANELVIDGEMDIYQFTFEKLQYIIKATKRDNYAAIVSSEKDGGDCDMFSDTFDAAKPVEKSAETEDAEEILWEFRWKDEENAEVQGPFPTSKMLAWQNDAYFDEVFVRKIGTTHWYSSKRIDFDLYT